MILALQMRSKDDYAYQENLLWTANRIDIFDAFNSRLYADGPG